MPVNPNSHLRKTRKCIHGWRDAEGDFCTSLKPRAENGPRNVHATAREALMEAAKRMLPIVWEKPEDIS
jgi:hypothetical protein